VDNFHAGIGQPGTLASGFNVRLTAHEQDAGEPGFRLNGLLDARDDDPATVVATHDIHCNSHNAASRRAAAPPARGKIKRPL